MSNLRILQVDVDGFDSNQALECCSTLRKQLPEDVILVPCIGNMLRLTAIHGCDIIYVNNKEYTGEELYTLLNKLRNEDKDNDEHN